MTAKPRETFVKESRITLQLVICTGLGEKSSPKAYLLERKIE